MQGFIKFKREWLDNPIIKKDSDHIAVFLYIAVCVQFEKIEALFGKEKITLNKGQMLTTKRQIYQELGIERNKLDRILRAFENEGIIEQQTNNHKTLITLLCSAENGFYFEEQNKEQMSNKGATNKEGENEKEKRSKREKEKEKEIIKEGKNVRECAHSTQKKLILGKYKNVVVDKEWYESFCSLYYYADKVIERLSLYKEGRGIEYVKDEPYLEEFAIQDKQKYPIRRAPTYGDAEEAFAAALARSYADDDDDDYDF